MKRALGIIAVVAVISVFLLTTAGCRTDAQGDGVPAGVTVTIPEGL